MLRIFLLVLHLHTIRWEVENDGGFYALAVPDVANGTEEAVQHGQTHVVEVDDARTPEIVSWVAHLVLQREYQAGCVEREIDDAEKDQ